MKRLKPPPPEPDAGMEIELGRRAGRATAYLHRLIAERRLHEWVNWISRAKNYPYLVSKKEKVKRSYSSPAGQGIPKSKPRLKRLLAKGNGNVSDQQLARSYLKERNRLLRLKNQQKELELAKERKDWIPRKQIELEAGLIFTAISGR